MLVTYKGSYLFFFVLQMQSIKLHCVCLQLCHIATTIIVAHSFRQFSLFFSMIKIHHQVKNCTYHQRIFNFCKISRNSTEISKFCGKGKIRSLAQFCGSWKTVGPIDKSASQSTHGQWVVLCKCGIDRILD